MQDWLQQVLLRCTQGLDWYKARLKQDRDGDVADEFLLERSDKSSKGPDKGLQVHAGFPSLTFATVSMECSVLCSHKNGI